jgi:predicted porin
METNTTLNRRESEPRGMRGLRVLGAGILLSALAGITGVAQAESSPPAAVVTSGTPDQSLTWHGITLYGIVDLGLQYDTHGAPFSDYHPAGSSNIVQKNSRQSVTGFTPSNLSQSRVGLQGAEPLMGGDWKAVFKLETFFNPQSGQISDALKSMVQNNGKPASQQGVNLDSSVAGQTFQTSFAGLSSRTFGTVVFGRVTGLVADGVSKYDPNYASQAFSLIGMSGTYAGGGDTENRRTDNTVKYNVTIADIARFGALYKFNNSNGAANTEYQVGLGGDFAGFSVDAFYSKINSGISSSPLSAAQIDGASVACPAVPAAGVSYACGASTFNALAATVSDNDVYSLMALYNLDVVKFFAGYENIRYSNPAHPLTAPFNNIGGYNLVIINNAAFPHAKVLDVYWGGIKWTALPGLDLTAAYYGYHQNSYGAGANAGCTTNKAATCSGDFESFSFDAVYAFTKRFDGYAGAMYSAVHDGLANGYDLQRTNINPTIGVRFKF